MTAFKPTSRPLPALGRNHLRLHLRWARLRCCSRPRRGLKSVLRVAMTAGDIPDWTGQPDQGSKAIVSSAGRFMTRWSIGICRAPDREAPLTQGLATKWAIDPANNKRWIFELRKGVKFHDGCALDADLVVWNIERLINDKTPRLPSGALCAPPLALDQYRSCRKDR